MRFHVSPRQWGAIVLVAAITMIFSTDRVSADSQVDSLLLYQPAGVRIETGYNGTQRKFKVFVIWEDIPGNCASVLHPADTTGWGSNVSAPVALPEVRGLYTGDVDRTFTFISFVQGGENAVGSGSMTLNGTIRGQEYYTVAINIGAGYDGQWRPLIFRDNRVFPPVNVDFGIEFRMGNGNVASGRRFIFGAEDFEGFHIWRGIESDGSDLEIIGELSKEEASRGRKFGGSLQDSVYFYEVIPTLRNPLKPRWISTVGSIECLGHSIDLRLGPDELFWYDCNAFNGFTYYYAVTTFDRGFNIQSSRQGLEKFDSCELPDPDVPGSSYLCADSMTVLALDLGAQDKLERIYAVPNPYRSGGSRLTTTNYHNFPDELVRFVNVPSRAKLRVYTISGDLVWEIQRMDETTGNVEWGLVNRSGEEVGSGVYIYRVESDIGSMYGRLVVIR